MIRSTYALVLLVCGGVALSACGNKGGDSSSSGAAVAASGAASAVVSATPTATASAAPAADTASAAPVATGVPQRPIDDCCFALAAMATTAGRGKHVKNKAFKAAEICPGIAVLVRQGRATRQQALTQIKSALVGYSTPPQCQ